MHVHRYRQEFPIRQSSILWFGLFGVAIGCLTPIAVDQVLSASNFWPSFVLVAIPILLLIAMRPVIGAVTVIGFSFVHPSFFPPLIELGELSLRYVDALFLLVIFLVLARMAMRRYIAISTEFRELFAPILLFTLYIGISLLIVPFSAPNYLAASIASYMRLLLTMLFAPVFYLVLTNKQDMHLFHKALMIFAIATIAVGAFLVSAGFEQGRTELLEQRYGGILGTSSFGLVSGLLVLYAFIKKDDRSCHSVHWVMSLTLGLFGLSLAKSAVSIFATAAAVAVYLAVIRSPRRSVPGFFRWVTITSTIAVAAIFAVWILRQHQMSGLVNLSGGSFAERLMIAYAGVLIFFENPLIGVGWRGSTAEGIVNTIDLSAAVLKAFPNVTTDYFFELPPPSLHNMYIQFLAELGIIGFALFAWVSFRTGKNVARILRSIPAGSPYRIWAQFYALGLIFLLIWWNCNPLYGGQTEAVLAFTFLAVLANVAQLEKQRVEQVQAGNMGSN